MNTENILSQIGSELLNNIEKSKVYKQRLIDKLDKIAERQQLECLYYDDMIKETEKGLQEATDPIKIEVWSKALEVVKESDRAEYNRLVDEDNESLKGD